METKTRIFGMPLISVGVYARGFIAIGWMGRGVILIAQFGYGVIAVTQFGFGIISISQFGLGLVTVGQFAFGLFLAIGQFALGFVANGINAFGYYRLTGPGVWNRLPDLFRLVVTHPFPFQAWGAVWIGIFIFLYFQRDKFSLKMSPADIFRSRKKNRDDAIRARAAASSMNQAELLDLVLNDSSNRVKRAALQNIFDPDKLLTIAKSPLGADITAEVINKIGDPRALISIVKDAAEISAQTAALEILLKKDQSVLVDLACELKNEKILDIAINEINDQPALRRIMLNAVSPHARQTALNHLADPGTDELYAVIKNDRNAGVRVAAAGRISDIRVLSEIIRGDFDLTVRAAAVTRMEDKKILSGLSAGNIPPVVQKAIAQRIEALKPFYYSIKAEFSCPYCSQPVFINTPDRKVSCRSCLRETAIPADFWKNLYEAGFGAGRFSGKINCAVEKDRKQPVCSRCQEPLATDEVATGSTEPVKCASCGTAHPTFPVPKWLTWSKYAEQVFASEDAGKSAGPDGEKPVAISCIKCGAPLEVTSATPRNATCRYCNTVQYLPDQLWLSLHPVTIKQDWYIRCGYRERI